MIANQIRTDSIHNTVIDRFSESWPNPEQGPIFQAARVYKIVLTPDRRDTYLGYRFVFPFSFPLRIYGTPDQ